MGFQICDEGFWSTIESFMMYLYALQPQWISTNVDLQEEEYGANEEIINLDRDILKSISGRENDLGLR